MAVKLPSAKNVTGAVDPSVARDPGLSVSPVAFGAAAGAGVADVGQGVAIATDEYSAYQGRLAQAELKRQGRNDALVIAGAYVNRANSVREEMRQREDTGDIWGDKPLAEWGQYLNENIEAVLKQANEQGLSPEGQDELVRMLIHQNDEFTVQFASKADEAGKANLDAMEGKILNPVYAGVTQNPGSLSSALDKIDNLMQLTDKARSREEEVTARQKAKAQAVMSSVNGAFSKNDPLTVQENLSAYGHLLDPKDFGAAVVRLNEFEDKQNKMSDSLRKGKELERIYGRPLTKMEWDDLYNVGSTQAPQKVVAEDGKTRWFAPGSPIHGQEAPEGGLKSYEATQDKLNAETVHGFIDKRSAIREEMQLNQAMQSVLETGGFSTGGMSEAVQAWAQNTFNVDLGTPEGYQLFGTLGARQLLSKAQQLPGTLSDGDMRVLQQAVAGNLRGTEANKIILQIEEKTQERAIERMSLTEQYFKDHGDLGAENDAWVNKQMRAKGDVIDDPMRRRIAYAQLNNEQLQKLPDEVAQAFVGTAKVAKNAVQKAIDGMKDEDLRGMPAQFLQEMQRLIEGDSASEGM